MSRPVQRYDSAKNVYEAALERIRWIFDHFPDGKIFVSISGGKDSEVLAFLTLMEAHRRGRRVGVVFLDEEAVYESTIEMVEYLMTRFPENTIPLWLQIEFNLTNSTSMTEGQLHAWEAGKHKDWMRPKREGAIKFKPWAPEKEKLTSGYKWLDFYGVIDNFERCYEGAAFLVGLRAIGESPHRWSAVTRHPIEVDGERVYWGTKRGANCTLYPLYDWNYWDIWKTIAAFGLKYSRIYDFKLLKGQHPAEMRVSSVIHEHSFAESLATLQEFEPRTYDKLLKRVKGIAHAAERGLDAKMFRCTKLPKNFKSWRTYRDFLLATYPNEEHRALFGKRFARHLDNEYVARQQCRQLVCSDVENNLGVDSRPDPRDALIDHYEKVL